MKINILLPHKEKFDVNLASSVSITIKNNFFYSNFKNNIKIFGQPVLFPIYPQNFVGIKGSYNPFKSKNIHLAKEMVNYINSERDPNQIIEVHNRPYLFKYLNKKLPDCPTCIFFHNDPNSMKGSKTIEERLFIKEHAKYIFCVSKFIKDQFLKGLNNNYDNVCVISNGVNRHLKKFPTKKNTILFAGRIVEEKGAQIFVEASEKLAKLFPNWKFVMIGSSKLGSLKIQSSFEKKIIQNFKKIGQQAQFFGFLKHENVQQKMSEASILIVPSTWEEPFGLVVAEGMSNGLAVVTSNVGGIPEIIGKNGIIIDKINSEKVVKEVSNLVLNPEVLKKLQKKSWNNFKHSACSSSYTLDQYRKKIVKDYF